MTCQKRSDERCSACMSQISANMFLQSGSVRDARSPFARLPATSVAWNLNSSSVVHSSTLFLDSLKSPELCPLVTFLLLFPPFLASARSKPASGFTTPCVTASSFLCSCPTISFFRFWSAASCASGVLGFASSLSAGGIVDRPMA